MDNIIPPAALLNPTQQSFVDSVIKDKITAQINQAKQTRTPPTPPPQVATVPVSILPVAPFTKEEYEKQINTPVVPPPEILSKLKQYTVDQQINSVAERQLLPNKIESVLEGNDLKVTVGDRIIFVRKMVAADWAVMKMTDNPIYLTMVGKMSEEEMDLKLRVPGEEMFDFVYQFTHPIKDVYKLAKNVDEYHSRATEEIGFVYSVNELTAIAATIMDFFKQVNQSRSEFEASDAPVEDKKHTASQ
jgi:hypothetical protein